MSGARGASALGRGVVVARGDEAPDAWAGTEVITVDDAVLTDPGPTVGVLHHAWIARRPFVVVLGVEAERFRAPEPITDAPWRLGARFELWLDRLHFLVWANTYDARDGREPVWWWARKAARVGATEITGPDAGDVLLPDGTAAWLAGGPGGPLGGAGLGAVVVQGVRC